MTLDEAKRFLNDCVKSELGVDELGYQNVEWTDNGYLMADGCFKDNYSEILIGPRGEGRDYRFTGKDADELRKCGIS